MSATELLAQLEAEDVRLSIRGDRLVLNAPEGLLTPDRLDELRPHKQALMALVAERQSDATKEEEPSRDSFDEIVEDARRFQREGRPGPWGAFTVGDEELVGLIWALQPDQRDDFDLRVGIYRRDDLPDDQARRIALFLLADEHNLPLCGR